ncbi:MAG: purine-binding chemotaxis protein CheW [Bdellovibrionaceae bacterium]|nr:purine-binding chemotaxis protein CheW [Pseudobdellovibrionaceae bacterium]
MRYLSFNLKEESFGVSLEQVREVISFPEISPVPGSSKKFLGISYLRNEILPIVDLRITFGMTPTLSYDTAVIVCEVDSKPYGIVVDCIHNVITPESHELKPKNETEGIPDYIQQIVYREEKICLILDVKSVLNTKELDFKKLLSSKERIKSAS